MAQRLKDIKIIGRGVPKDSKLERLKQKNEELESELQKLRAQLEDTAKPEPALAFRHGQEVWARVRVLDDVTDDEDYVNVIPTDEAMSRSPADIEVPIADVRAEELPPGWQYAKGHSISPGAVVLIPFHVDETYEGGQEIRIRNAAVFSGRRLRLSSREITAVMVSRTKR